MLVPLLDEVKRRLGDIYAAVLDERLHVAVEERQKQSTDMCSVNIGICHDDDFAIAALRQVKVLGDTVSESGDHCTDFRVREDFVEACLLYVENLTAERKDCLESSVTSLFCGAACGVTLYEVNLSLLRVPYGAVGKLARETRYLKGVLSAGELACFSCSHARAGCHDGFFKNPLCDCRILLEEFRESFCNDGVNNTAYLGVSELRLRLSLELRLMNLEADDACKSFADVLACEVFVICLQYT